MPHLVAKVLSKFPVLLLVLTLTLPARAYDYPLSSTAIREAYFLGRRCVAEKTVCLGDYAKRLPLPEHGPYISEIDLFTPYAQVVLRSWRNSVGYSAQQAEGDYLSHGKSIQVRVRIEFSSTYNGVQGAKAHESVAGENDLIFRRQDFWRDFHFKLSQKNNQVKPRDLHGEPIYDDSGFRGAEVWLEYDADLISSEDTLFEISIPGEHDLVTKFDLSKLR